MIRAFQWDLARQVERLDVLQRLLPRYARWGYQELYLHLEDAVHYPGLPGVGRTDAYTHAELGALVDTATRCGIRVVPIVNLLGHTQYLIKHRDLRDLNELRDEQGRPLDRGQVCPLHPRLPEIAAALLQDVAPFCTAGKVHVGLDESFHLGRCPRCRAEIDRIGLAGHFAGHVNRLHELVSARGLRLGLWADMLYFIPEAIPLLPPGITAYDWYYYPFNRKPRVEFFNFAERDLQPALRRQGIGYYGCPMNGAFRYEPLPVFGDRLANIRSWWQRCQAVKAEGMLITSWEAYRLALETTTVVDAAAASLWLQSGPDDATSLLADGLVRAVGSRAPRPQARALLAADAHAFAGYARWQINERWDAFAGDESLKPYAAELKYYTRLQSPTHDWPPAFSSSLSFRLYLAKRDVFVREAARAVYQLRRLLKRQNGDGLRRQLTRMQQDCRAFALALKSGRQAARAMWTRTRNRQAHGQNEVLVELDRQRLADWQRWLTRAGKHPELIMGSSPVCGAWQIQFRVHNDAPASQKVIVEQQAIDGTWREIASRHTIEFRAPAARPRSRIVREFSAPLDRPDLPLRVRVAGVGTIRVSLVILTNGLEIRRGLRPKHNRRIGIKAPTRGFPDLEANERSSQWEIRWK